MVVTLQSKARDVPNETGQAFAGTFGDLRHRNENLVWYEVLINDAVANRVPLARSGGGAGSVSPEAP